MKVALFLTTELEPARALAQQVRRDHAEATVHVYVRDEQREPLAAELAGWDVRRDKPAGGRLRFVRALRRERYDRVVVAWHGGERWLPLRLLAPFVGARQVLAGDERGRWRTVRWHAPWTWAGHVARRAAGVKVLTVLRVVATCYRRTLGALIATLLALPMALALVLGALPGRKS